ncbi:DUF3093 domain-containing protein [Corynebacterium tuscaniense]|uniref:DUF3093 domain-containing protein n=1 Tax=Corynebacterium tuscaniense TaxID=302449 RepID=A0A2N6T4H2_9CORY|nr:DUF3093 domain-containing protein [Corynebacterium tuscaniense]PMC64220.1 DUF3093 domain-containing protein [Corynebacterium tuscaniense]
MPNIGAVSENNETSNATTAQTPNSGASTVLYSERQWVPVWWWVLAVAFAGLIGAQVGHNRSMVYFIATFLIVGALLAWYLTYLSSTVVKVEQDPDGTRWLVVGDANLPHTVVPRSLAVPKTAKQNALGRQLDPAAYLIHHAWVKELALFVLNDPEDPTPYWLISTKNPEALLRAFVPDQADAAVEPLGR